MAKAPVFLWNESYLVGNEEIDNQHRRIFKLANTLPEKCGEASARSIIARLFEHAAEHFESEERMMRQLGYPKTTEHRELHADLVKNLQAMSANAFDSDEKVLAFKQFVYDWVTDHIMTQDQDFFRFTREG